MSVAHRREAERLVGARILLVPHPDEGSFEEFDDCGKHFFAWEAVPREVFLHALTNGGESLAELDHASVLGVVAYLAPARVVAVLLATFGVAPRCLDVTVRIGANPHIGPSRGY